MEERPWGAFEVLYKGDKFLVKKLVVKPGKRTSLQYHLHREEYWIIIEGEGQAWIGEKKISIGPGDFLKIGKKVLHRIENTGKEDLVIVEVWVGEKLEEEDIVRVQDDYGRA